MNATVLFSSVCLPSYYHYSSEYTLQVALCKDMTVGQVKDALKAELSIVGDYHWSDDQYSATIEAIERIEGKNGDNAIAFPSVDFDDDSGDMESVYAFFVVEFED